MAMSGYGFCFSSRRRHTRCYRDWSSDVCSSDLLQHDPGVGKLGLDDFNGHQTVQFAVLRLVDGAHRALAEDFRSEERRVGKECRSGRWAYRYSKTSSALLTDIAGVPPHASGDV